MVFWLKIIKKCYILFPATLVFLSGKLLYAQDTSKSFASAGPATFSNTTSKSYGVKGLASFVLGNLWEETRKRLNLDNVSIKKEEENNKTTYNFNVKSRKVNISGKIPKKL